MSLVSEKFPAEVILILEPRNSPDTRMESVALVISIEPDSLIIEPVR